MLTSCSSDKEKERDYPLPHALCDVDVKPALLKPFLPAGDKISTRRVNPDGGTERCQVIVDGTYALFASRIWWGGGGGLVGVGSVHAQVEPEEAKGGDKYLYSGTGAVGKPKACTDPKHPQQDLYTVIQVFTKGHDDVPAMKKLITEYTNTVEGTARWCTPKGRTR